MRLTQRQQDHIKTLADAHGRLSARIILNDARKLKSPLHTLSVWRGWDHKRLAETQLLHCARLVLGSVTYQFTHNERVIKSVAYVVDTSQQGRDGGGYRSVQAMAEDPNSARESLIYTLEVAAGHLRRAYDLAAPLGLATEIDALLAQIAGVKRIAESNKKAA